MPEYNLTLTFTKEQVGLITGVGERLVLMKTSPTSEMVSLAWLSIQDLWPTNKITWVTQYGLYASTTAVQDGATIQQLAEVDGAATPRSTYTFGDDNVAIFTGPAPDPNISADQYRVQNSYTKRDTLTFGLSQAATVQGVDTGLTPVNAISVLKARGFTFSPLEGVTVFLAADIDQGTVLTSVESPTTAFLFGGPHPTGIEAAYNSDTGTFDIVKQVRPPSAGPARVNGHARKPGRIPQLAAQ